MMVGGSKIVFGGNYEHGVLCGVLNVYIQLVIKTVIREELGAASKPRLQMFRLG